MTLEEKIKKLMEGKSSETAAVVVEETLDEKVTVKSPEGEEMTMDDSKDKMPEDDETEDADKDEDGEDTDYAKDVVPTTKNKADVKEDFAAPAYNSTLQASNKKDPMAAKVKEAPSDADGKIGDAGLNAKLKVGAARKDGEGVKASSTSGENAEVKKNNVDKQDLPTKKSGVKEHTDAMFDGEDLSEEFKEKATTIFEAAVSQAVEERLAEELEQFQEAFDGKLEEAVSEVQSTLVEQIDGFLNRVIKEWVSENQVALESGIKVEMVNDFMNGLKTLFTEHYIEVPEDKLDVVEEQANRISELENALVAIDEAHNVSVAEISRLQKQSVIESVGSSLTHSQKEKFAKLVEGIEFESKEQFTTKATTIKESYFKGTKEVKQFAEAISPVLEESVQTTQVSSYVNAYASALSKPSKF